MPTLIQFSVGIFLATDGLYADNAGAVVGHVAYATADWANREVTCAGRFCWQHGPLLRKRLPWDKAG
ncbi:hypothetical protein [Dokdonella sp.]|uniref:hypothetical protein n=1 Tax=Dokdonella sp. TaxID=2291710 RepID=UPI003C78ACA4